MNQFTGKEMSRDSMNEIVCNIVGRRSRCGEREKIYGAPSGVLDCSSQARVSFRVHEKVTGKPSYMAPTDEVPWTPPVFPLRRGRLHLLPYHPMRTTHRLTDQQPPITQLSGIKWSRGDDLPAAKPSSHLMTCNKSATPWRIPRLIRPPSAMLAI